jgi:hypothetical protein
MIYSNGQTCGRKGRSVQLALSCGHPNFEIPAQSITEVERGYRHGNYPLTP